MREALDAGLTRLALVGMGCQTSSPPVMWDRKAGKVGKPFVFNIGLLCSKTFDDAIFPELFEAKYGLKKADMAKMNIKGVFQIWMKDGSYHEIDLKECHQWTREGCKSCPDFAAEHSDIATGGIGEDNDWTLTIVRTELGEEVINRMIADGVDHRPPGAGGREGDEAAAAAVDRQPPTLAGVGRQGTVGRRASSEEEGTRACRGYRTRCCGSEQRAWRRWLNTIAATSIATMIASDTYVLMWNQCETVILMPTKIKMPPSACDR